MDFEQARNAHFDWKRKLSDYMRRPDGSLNAADVAKDNHCVLGKWLHGEGKMYDALSEYSELLTVHADFHREASEVILKADSGVPVSEEIALGAKSPYNAVSTRVTLAIKKLERAASSRAGR